MIVNETSGKKWNKFVLLPKIKNDQKARESNFQKLKYKNIKIMIQIMMLSIFSNMNRFLNNIIYTIIDIIN